ncbi:hypothetical protein BGW36DRAFT_401821 [Talaromyces proteolyticus]|uniref:Rhodopsin domain-containing protein n=1 Tax=Talaromyces proteolyticus TaxID=1131652 RepID=A0AAD4PTY1_9EURO|nr:uncharacterized protein BGW36DRAFT_401821 [Talaromyces proteolyticus]KAH8689461.1 hypothetical protein BGW36DRAFT_401821 [Talaromyces proteolyticus]
MEAGPTLANHAAPTYSGVWVVMSVSTIAFGLRLFSRASITSDLGWEDLVMAIGWCITLASTIVYTLSVHVSVIASTSTENLAKYLPDALRLNLIATGISIIALMVPKISIALLLTRILNSTRVMKWLIISISVLALVMGVIAVIIEFEQCDPVPGQWDPERYHPKCWPASVQMNYSYFVGSWSAFLDFFYAIYPASVIWKLNMANSRKIDLSILMGLGIVSGSVAIYKTSQFHLLQERGGVVAEALYVMSQLSMWTIIETNITIIAACIPLTSPVFRAAKRRAAPYLREVGINVRSTRTDKHSNRSQNEHELSSQNRTQIYVHHDIQVESNDGRESDRIPLSSHDLP